MFVYLMNFCSPYWLFYTNASSLDFFFKTITILINFTNTWIFHLVFIHLIALFLIIKYRLINEVKYLCFLSRLHYCEV